ncbi:MAG: hypothetical protein JXA54_08300 [Candidatus Heimdallarchaeota archaeon]|nr:hypothetical protein [Candidatus Heimdallarchaeota archaeon]
MNKKVLTSILVIGIFVILGATATGLGIAFTPTSDSELEIVSVTSQETTDTVTVVLTCEGNQTGHNYRHQRNFAYMHQIQFKNASTDEVLYQEQYQWQWRHRIQNGQNFMYQFQIEGLESGQMLQLRIEYNNGKVLTYNFVV